MAPKMASPPLRKRMVSIECLLINSWVARNVPRAAFPLDDSLYNRVPLNCSMDDLYKGARASNSTNSPVPSSPVTYPFALPSTPPMFSGGSKVMISILNFVLCTYIVWVVIQVLPMLSFQGRC